MPSVTIALTSPHTIPSRFLQPFLAIVSYTHQKVGPVNVSISTHYCTYEARNICMRDALKANSDYIFFLDVDVLAHPDIIEQLLKSGKEIVSGPYHMKTPPYRPIAFTRSGNEGEYDLNTSIEEEKLYEVDGVGGGCLLIKRGVLEKISEPYFDVKLNGKNLGEDLYFCHKAQEAGYKIWYDNTIFEVRHLGASVGFSDFKLWNYHVKQGHVKFNAKKNEKN